MKKNFRRVKSGIIFGILLISLFAVFAPSASAGILNADPLITCKVPEESKNIIPNTGFLDISITTTFTLTGPWAFIIENHPLLRDTTIPISITIENENEVPGIDASLTNSNFDLPLSGTESRQTKLTLTVTEDIQQNTQGRIDLKVTSSAIPGGFFGVSKSVLPFQASFIIGYWPVISLEPTKGTFMEIGPLDTADFEIDIENLGNGATYVAIELVDVPEDEWSINIPSSVILASAVGDSDAGVSKTAIIKVKPPHGFGLHNEVKQFKVRFTPSLVGDHTQFGQIETVVFTVQSAGMSPGLGFEIPLIVTVLVLIGFMFYFFRRIRQRK